MGNGKMRYASRGVLGVVFMLFASSPICAVDLGPDWFLIKTGLTPKKEHTIAGKSKISDKIIIRGELLDIKVDYPVIHCNALKAKMPSSITMKYRINEATLPTGPLYVTHCWHTWVLTKLPVKIGKRPSNYRDGLCDGIIGSSGKLPLPGKGEFTETCEMTKLRSKSIPNGIYGIGRIAFPGYIVDPDNPKIKDIWNMPRTWRQNQRFMEQTTVLIADLTKYKIHFTYDTEGTKGSDFEVKIMLEDANGNMHPIPNATVEAIFKEAKTDKGKKVVLKALWEDDPVTMTFRVPTGWYKSACPFDIEQAIVKIKVGMGLPTGDKKVIEATNTYKHNKEE